MIYNNKIKIFKFNENRLFSKPFKSKNWVDRNFTNQYELKFKFALTADKKWCNLLMILD